MGVPVLFFVSKRGFEFLAKAKLLGAFASTKPLGAFASTKPLGALSWELVRNFGLWVP